MKKRLTNYKNWIAISMILVAVSCLLSVQASSGNVIIGYDTFFHFNRIYDTAMQIEHHRFSYFMANFGYVQSGQIVNAVYGPYMAYFLGFLLFLTHSWVNFQLLSACVLLFVSGIGAFVLFRRLRINHWLATAGAIIFLSQNFITYWITSSAFLDWGAMMLPFALMVGLDLLSGKAKRIHISLAIVVAILIEMHILSAVITVLMLIPFLLVGIWRSSEKGLYVKKIGLNIGLTLLLTCNYFVAFFNVFGSNHLIAPFRVQSLQSGGMQLVNDTLIQGGMGLVFIIIVGLQVFFSLINVKRNPLNLMLTTVGLAFLAISSEYFPWDKLGKIFPVFRDFLQFPSRFYAVAALLLLTGFLLSMNHFMQQTRIKSLWYFYGIVVSSLAITSVMIGMTNIRHQLDNNWRTYNMAPQAGVYAQHLLPYGYYPKKISNDEIKTDFRSSNLYAGISDSVRANTDYLPNLTFRRQPRDLQALYKKQITYNTDQFEKYPQVDGSMKIIWQSNQVEMTMIPEVIYHDSIVHLNGKRLLHPRLSKIGGLSVQSQKGINQLYVKYQAPLYVRIALGVSILSWLFLLGYGFFRLIKKLR